MDRVWYSLKVTLLSWSPPLKMKLQTPQVPPTLVIPFSSPLSFLKCAWVYDHTPNVPSCSTLNNRFHLLASGVGMPTFFIRVSAGNALNTRRMDSGASCTCLRRIVLDPVFTFVQAILVQPGSLYRRTVCPKPPRLEFRFLSRRKFGSDGK